MITICARWESLQMPPELEWRMWRQLRGAFHINRFVFSPVVPELQTVSIDQFETMPEALRSLQGRKVFLEPLGNLSLREFAARPHEEDEDISLILGNTQHGNYSLAEDCDDLVRIDTPGSTDLYGINAAAIALAYWHGQ